MNVIMDSSRKALIKDGGEMWIGVMDKLMKGWIDGLIGEEINQFLDG